MGPRLAGALTIVCVATNWGCAAAGPPKLPPGAPPTPTTVTKNNPGGDADDPELAALVRLGEEPWGDQRDRWASLHVPLMDAKNWRRVKIWGHPTRANFRYGDDHWAVATIWYTPFEGESSPEACIERFKGEALPVALAFGVEVNEPVLAEGPTEGLAGPMVVELVDGKIDSLLKSDEYVGAVAAYTSWPGTCLVQGFAVAAGAHREEATRVRDRWVEEGAAKLEWRVKEPPEPLTR